MRHVRERTERSGLPQSVFRDCPHLIFDVDGTCHGSTYPLSPHHLGRDRSTYLRVRADSDDPDELSRLEDQLARVRVERPSGRGVLPA